MEGEALEHSVDVEFDLVSEGKQGEILAQDGNVVIIEGQINFISLYNQGDTTIFVSGF